MSVIRQLASICFIAVFTVNPVSSSPTASSPWQCDKFLCRFTPQKPGKSSWSKYDGLTNLVVFGASYATAGSTQDILDPKPPYKTSCNGPNYVDFLSNGLSKTVVTPKSYAIPGSPVSLYVLDNGKVPPGETNSFIYQVDSYVADLKKGNLPALPAKSTLYTTMFGINDISRADTKYSSLESAIFDKYQSEFDRLYQSGARNFLVLNTPPIDRSPEAAAQRKATLWKNSVISFNTQLTKMLETLGNKYPDAVFFRMGVNGLFSSVLDNPSYSGFTKGYKDTTHTCKAYVPSTNANSPTLPSKDYKSPQCEYAVSEYFWFAGYHPTYPVHEALASEIADGLQTL